MIFTLEKGAVASGLNKQKLNSMSSKEAVISATDNNICKIVCIKRFLEHQDFKVKVNIIYEDNTITIKLLNNCRLGAGKRTRHFGIKLFYITDLISRNEVEVRYCPTDQMIADYMSKPVIGAKFKFLRDLILNLSVKNHQIGQ